MTPIEETFREVQPNLYGAIAIFMRTHSMPWDDARSTANLKFVEAYHDYDPEKGKFISWVVGKALYGLLEDIRTMLSSRRRIDPDFDPDTLEDIPENEYGKGLEELLTKILGRKNKNIRYVIKLALNPPKEILQTLKEYGDHSGASYRMAIRWYLQHNKGWSMPKVDRVFKRIKDLL